MADDSASSSPDPSDATAALQARVAELERRLGVLQGVLDALPFGVFWKDTQLVYRGCNPIGFAASGLDDITKFLGHTDDELPWNRDQADAFVADDRDVLARRAAKPHIVESVRDAHGNESWVETYKAPVLLSDGELAGVVGVFRDITAERRAEQAALSEQQEVMRQLATPLLPVAEGVVVLPLIGTLDPARASYVMETLLAGVVQHRAAFAILDITGLHTVDTAAAEALVRAARAIGLLGATAVLTGVRPGVARMLVDLGAELGDLVVLGDLKAGIQHALQRPRR